MSDALTPRPVDTARYRVRLLEDPRVTEAGVAYRCGREVALLAWSRVRRALTAEVGEPEGVRTVVFDLVVELGPDGCEVFRFDADPFEDAMEVARAIQGAVGDERVAPSVKSVATDGQASRHYPDLEALARGALQELDLA